MRKTSLILAAALFALLLIPAGASAYRFQLDDVGASGDVRVTDADPALSSTIRVTNGGIEDSRNNVASGTASPEVTAMVNAGWVVEIYQPGIPAGPPAVQPTAKLVVPNISISALPGASSVGGSGPDGWSIEVQRSSSCVMSMDLHVALISGGTWSTPLSLPAHGQDGFGFAAISPSGDRISPDQTYRVPGDGQCVMVSASSSTGRPIAKPFAVTVSGLDSTIPTTRTVLRRGATVLGDENGSSLELPSTARPSPGDMIDVYRPQGAPTPAYSFTIPQVSSVYDIASNLVAIDGPAAARAMAAPCRPFSCSLEYALYGSTGGATAAGRTLITMRKERSGPYDIARAFLPGDLAIAGWQSPDGGLLYFFDSVAGDLTAPKAKLKASKSLKAGRLKSVRLKLTSNEAGSATLTLTADAVRKGGKALKLGSLKKNVKVGSNRLTLKLSKSGKKSIKKLAKAGKNRKAKLTTTVKDAAGNATTVVATTTLKF